MSRRLIIAALVLSLGCGDGPAALETHPSILQVAVEGNPFNVLSAVVRARVAGADSVAVEYVLADGGEIGRTPAIPAGDSILALGVLGLFPERAYRLRLLAWGSRELIMGSSLEFTTGSLPSDLPRYTAGGPDPSPGFVVFSAGPYGLVIDNTGRVVWYHRVPEPGPGLAFMAQPTGRYTTRPAPTPPASSAPWIEIDPMGRVTGTMDCAGGLAPRLHDLLALTDGSYWLLCDDPRVMDLSHLGGSDAAVVTGTAVQRVSRDGRLLFHWTPFDHLDLAQAPAAALTGETVNWTHGNSLDLDADGNLLVSFRNLSQVTRIDTRTGAVLWRFGGQASDFTLADGPEPPFTGQHSVRALANGAVLLLDNAGDPRQSRAERYALSDGGRVARLTGALGAGDGVVTVIGGSVQALPGGRTLVSFGTTGRVEEYDAAGRVAWRIVGNAGYVFRAQRIASLYAPGAGTSR